MSTPIKHYSFADVYTSVLSKIQDNNLVDLRSSDEFLFMQKMYNYMLDAIAEYTIPSSIYPILSDRINPEYTSVEYVVDYTTNEIDLSANIPNENTILRCSVDGQSVDFTYDETNKKIILSYTETENYTCLYETYIIGIFVQGLTDRQLAVLASFTVYIWALQVSNNEEDITRLLLDGDFKMASEATVTNAKTAWVNSYWEKAYALMNSNDWGYTFLSNNVDSRPPTMY